MRERGRRAGGREGADSRNEGGRGCVRPRQRPGPHYHLVSRASIWGSLPAPRTFVGDRKVLQVGGHGLASPGPAATGGPLIVLFPRWSSIYTRRCLILRLNYVGILYVHVYLFTYMFAVIKNKELFQMFPSRSVCFSIFVSLHFPIVCRKGQVTFF